MCLWCVCVCVCGMPMCGVYMWGVLVYMVCVLCRVYGICIDMFLYVSHRLFITVMKHLSTATWLVVVGGVILS